MISTCQSFGPLAQTLDPLQTAPHSRLQTALLALLPLLLRTSLHAHACSVQKATL